MGMFLNSIIPYETYKAVVYDPYFVDKTSILDELMPLLGKMQRYICITRPRRFGKTVMANMIGAFFGKIDREDEVFQCLKIAMSNQYGKHLHRHNVIYIDFSRIPEDCVSYAAYIARIRNGLKKELAETYDDLNLDISNSVWDILNEIFVKKDRTKFIFVLDEWDAIFHMPFVTDKDKQAYLLFLKSLLKDQEYAEFVYMTGVLPIAKYSDGSELNMFVEFQMTTMEQFSEYFGFTDDEVDELYQKYLEVQKNPKVTREGLREWYDGYYTAGGKKLYNPRSVVLALTYNQLSNYWTSSGTYDSIFGYIKDNVDEIQDDLALMFAGEAIPADIQEYAAVSQQLCTKDEIYSAMLVYGLLTYKDGCVSIPNKELMDSYAAMMKKERTLGYVYRLASESTRMLNAYDKQTKEHACKVEVLKL